MNMTGPSRVAPAAVTPPAPVSERASREESFDDYWRHSPYADARSSDNASHYDASGYDRQQYRPQEYSPQAAAESSRDAAETASRRRAERGADQVSEPLSSTPVSDPQSATARSPDADPMVRAEDPADYATGERLSEADGGARERASKQAGSKSAPARTAEAGEHVQTAPAAPALARSSTAAVHAGRVDPGDAHQTRELGARQRPAPVGRAVDSGAQSGRATAASSELHSEARDRVGDSRARRAESRANAEQPHAAKDRALAEALQAASGAHTARVDALAGSPEAPAGPNRQRSAESQSSAASARFRPAAEANGGSATPERTSGVDSGTSDSLAGGRGPASDLTGAKSVGAGARDSGKSDAIGTGVAEATADSGVEHAGPAARSARSVGSSVSDGGRSADGARQSAQLQGRTSNHRSTDTRGPARVVGSELAAQPAAQKATARALRSEAGGQASATTPAYGADGMEAAASSFDTSSSGSSPFGADSGLPGKSGSANSLAASKGDGLVRGEGEDGILRLKNSGAGDLEAQIERRGDDVWVRVRSDDPKLRDALVASLPRVQAELSRSHDVQGAVYVSEWSTDGEGSQQGRASDHSASSRGDDAADEGSAANARVAARVPTSKSDHSATRGYGDGGNSAHIVRTIA